MRRAHNEDAFLVRDDLPLYVVADGMGGHAAGEIASEEAVNCVYDMVLGDWPAIESYRNNPSPTTLAVLRRVVVRAIEGAAYRVFGMAEQAPDRKGMGTTVTALLLVDDVAILGSVGDSRAYLFRGSNTWQVTEDHTVAQLQIKAGLISPEDARTSPRGHVLTRAVGPRDHVQVDVYEVPIEVGDRYLLCSDGLHGHLEQNEISPIVRCNSLEQSAQQLIDFANRRGGSDNITCVLVEVLDKRALAPSIMDSSRNWPRIPPSIPQRS